MGCGLVEEGYFEIEIIRQKDMTKKKGKKIGCLIATHPGQNNYGTSLQGFATLKVVAKAGYKAEIIRYKHTRDIAFTLRTFIPYIRSGGINGYLRRKQKVSDMKVNDEYRRTYLIRRAAVDAFKNEFFESIAHEYTGYKELHEGSKNYDVVFVGSDQVWGPLSLYRGFYNLLFVDDSVKKFSYASSFGVSEIFPWQRKGTAGYLNRLDMISVREQRGAEIVRELTGREAKVALDPTLLLTKGKWEECINEWDGKRERTSEPKSIDEPYILTYILGERADIREEIKKLSQESGIKIVNLPHIDIYHAMDDGLGDIDLYDVDPLDFVRLVKDASYVVTDSFHGSVFSILMHKKFITFYRAQPTSKSSTHSRIDSLFALFGLKQRLFQGDIWGQMQQDIDYDEVDRKIAAMREDSMKFFLKGLNL